MSPTITTKPNSCKIITKVDDKKTKVSKRTKVDESKSKSKAKANLEKIVKKATKDTKKCKAFYKLGEAPTTKWALALKAVYDKGIIPIKGPHNAHGRRIRLGNQPCGCRISMGITNGCTLAAERQVRDFLIGPRNKKQRKKRSTIKILHPPFQITSRDF
jgi:hypothetical protein